MGKLQNNRAIAQNQVFNSSIDQSIQVNNPAKGYCQLVLWAGICTVVLSACGKTLDSQKIEATIKTGIEKQGNFALKSVSCPNQIRLGVGQAFECVGEIDSERRFLITATQQDDQGNIQWQVPNSKGLLNLAKLATYFQQTMQRQLGRQFTIDCGGIYRVNKPGDRFQCQVIKLPKQSAAGKAPTQQVTEKTPAITQKGDKFQPDFILVQIDAQGDISWQQVQQEKRAEATAKLDQQPVTTTTAASAALTPVTSASTPALPAAKTAEDFLNQPGATDSWED